MNRNLGSQLFLFRCDLVVSLFTTSTIICALVCSFNFRPNNMIFSILLNRFLTARIEYAQMKAYFWLSVTHMDNIFMQVGQLYYCFKSQKAPIKFWAQSQKNGHCGITSLVLRNSKRGRCGRWQ